MPCSTNSMTIVTASRRVQLRTLARRLRPRLTILTPCLVLFPGERELVQVSRSIVISPLAARASKLPNLAIRIQGIPLVKRADSAINRSVALLRLAKQNMPHGTPHFYPPGSGASIAWESFHDENKSQLFEIVEKCQTASAASEGRPGATCPRLPLACSRYYFSVQRNKASGAARSTPLAGRDQLRSEVRCREQFAFEESDIRTGPVILWMPQPRDGKFALLNPPPPP